MVLAHGLDKHGGEVNTELVAITLLSQVLRDRLRGNDRAVCRIMAERGHLCRRIRDGVCGALQLEGMPHKGDG